MENQHTADFRIEVISHRAELLKRISEGVDFTEGEQRFLRMATQEVETWATGIAALYSARLLSQALEMHSRALTQAAEASDRYAKDLGKATWALVAVTAVLALATVALLFASR